MMLDNVHENMLYVTDFSCKEPITEVNCASLGAFCHFVYYVKNMIAYVRLLILIARPSVCRHGFPSSISITWCPSIQSAPDSSSSSAAAAAASAAAHSSTGSTEESKDPPVQQ